MPGKQTAHPFDAEIGARIRARRIQLGLSMEALGNLLGVTYQQIQKYEKGANSIRPSTMKKVADALDTPLGYLYENVTGRPSPENIALSKRENMELIRDFQKIGSRTIRDRVRAIVKTVAASYCEGKQRAA